MPHPPPAVWQVLARVLAREPDRRYQSARRLALDLDRCRTQASGGEPDRVAVGVDDAADRLVIGSRLYGRNTRLMRLHGVLESVHRERKPRLACITGSAGLGKSALLARFTEDVFSSGGVIAAVRASKPPTTAPFETLSQLLTELAAQLMAQEHRWRPVLANALGPYARALVEL